MTAIRDGEYNDLDDRYYYLQRHCLLNIALEFSHFTYLSNFDRNENRMCPDAKQKKSYIVKPKHSSKQLGRDQA